VTRLAYFLAGLIVGAWCAGLAMRWEQLRPTTDDAWRDLEGDDGAVPWRELVEVESMVDGIVARYGNALDRLQ